MATADYLEIDAQCAPLTGDVDQDVLVSALQTCSSRDSVRACADARLSEEDVSELRKRTAEHGLRGYLNATPARRTR